MHSEEIPFHVPWITDEDRNAVLEALHSRWLTSGPKVAQFEKSFAEYVGVKHAVAVSNCTAALHLTMRMLGIGSGDEVIVPVFTFAATANAALYCGAKPVFADIEERSFNISPKEIQDKLTNRTKAVIVVHYGGQPCDMHEITEIAEDSKILVVEDCAHSLGAAYRNRRTGSIGIAGCFSFYPTKNITTIEGGMITTNDEKRARKAKLLREHCMTTTAFEREDWSYDILDLGYNYRMNEVQAALGTSQLTRVDKANGARIDLAGYYDSSLRGIEGIVLPRILEERSHVYHLYAIRVKKDQYGLSRDELYAQLRAQGVGLSVHYTPLHLLTHFKEISGAKFGDFPVAETAYQEVLSLPLFPTLTRPQIDRVSKGIREAHRLR
jgi:perosamine synthetase